MAKIRLAEVESWLRRDSSFADTSRRDTGFRRLAEVYGVFSMCIRETP